MTNSENWYILKTKNKKEKKVVSLLNENNIETMLPLYTVYRKWSDRLKKIKTPLFANYVFVKRNGANKNEVFLSDDIINYLYIAKNIAKLQPIEISNIKRLCENENEIEVIASNNELVKGNEIIIDTGPLMGMKGIIANEKGSNYLMVSFPTLNSFAKIKINKKNIIKV